MIKEFGRHFLRIYFETLVLRESVIMVMLHDQLLVHTTTNIVDSSCNKHRNLCSSFLNHPEVRPFFSSFLPDNCPEHINHPDH